MFFALFVGIAQAQFSKTIYVVPGVPVVAVITWYQANCVSVAVGSYAETTAPKYGAYQGSVQSFPIPGCNTGPQPATVAYYTWTSTDPAIKSDYFQLNYVLNGGVAEVIEITVELQADYILSILGPSSVWWFNGEQPAGYATSIELTALPDNYGPYTWVASTKPGGTGSAVFSNGASTMVTTTNTVTLSGQYKSKNSGDVNVTVTSAIGTSHPLPVTVLAPERLVPAPSSPTRPNPLHVPNALFGYTSYVQYAIQDNLHNVLPLPVPINEQWDTSLINDYPSTDWVRGNACGTTGECQTLNPSGWADAIDGQCELPLICIWPIPRAFVPQSPLGNTAVDHWSGHWFVGSGTPGKGVSVQSDTWQKFQDHALHTNVVSPAP